MSPFYSAIGVVVKLFLAMICGECFIQFMPPLVIALQYKNNFNYNLPTENTISHVFSLFSSFSSLCILSHDDDLFDILIDQIRYREKIIALVEFEKASLFKCESILLLNLNRCSDLEKLNTEKYQFSVHMLNHYSLLNLTVLENCFYNSISPEVVILSLDQFSLFELSPIFPPPRRFTKSSVSEVLNHRAKRVREDLGGIQITGAFIFYPPFTIVPDGVDEPDTFDGIEVLLFRHLSRQLNFTLRYLLFNNWGVVGHDGVWRSGVGQAMQLGKAQVAVANIWQFSSLYKIMDFGPSITKAKLGFIVRRPEQIDVDWRSLMGIFRLDVWLIALLSFAISAAVYCFGINRGHASYQEDWTRSVMAVLGHFTMSTSHNYRSDGDHFSRFVLTSWSLFSLLITTLLSSGIYCSLTLPLYSARVDTLRQLVEGGYYWTAQYYSRLDNEDLRQSMFNFQDRWNYLFEKKYRFLERSEVETRTYYDEKITFLVQTYGNDLIILDTDGLHGHSALREFRMAEEETSETHITFGVEKNSPLLKPLSKMTVRFLEVGLLQHWKAAVIRRWQIHDTRHLLVERDDPTFSEPDVLRLKKLQPIFYLLLMGLSFSFITFCLELIWYFS